MNAITLGRMVPALDAGFDRLRLISHTLTLQATTQEQVNWLQELILTCDGVSDVLDELFGVSDDAIDDILPDDLPRLVAQQWTLQPPASQP